MDNGNSSIRGLPLQKTDHRINILYKLPFHFSDATASEMPAKMFSCTRNCMSVDRVIVRIDSRAATIDLNCNSLLRNAADRDGHCSGIIIETRMDELVRIGSTHETKNYIHFQRLKLGTDIIGSLNKYTDREVIIFSNCSMEFDKEENFITNIMNLTSMKLMKIDTKNILVYISTLYIKICIGNKVENYIIQSRQCGKELMTQKKNDKEINVSSKKCTCISMRNRKIIKYHVVILTIITK